MHVDDTPDPAGQPGARWRGDARQPGPWRDYLDDPANLDYSDGYATGSGFPERPGYGGHPVRSRAGYGGSPAGPPPAYRGSPASARPAYRGSPASPPPAYRGYPASAPSAYRGSPASPRPGYTARPPWREQPRPPAPGRHAAKRGAARRAPKDAPQPATAVAMATATPGFAQRMREAARNHTGAAALTAAAVVGTGVGVGMFGFAPFAPLTATTSGTTAAMPAAAPPVVAMAGAPAPSAPGQHHTGYTGKHRKAFHPQPQPTAQSSVQMTGSPSAAGGAAPTTGWPAPQSPRSGSSAPAGSSSPAPASPSPSSSSSPAPGSGSGGGSGSGSGSRSGSGQGGGGGLLGDVTGLLGGLGL